MVLESGLLVGSAVRVHMAVCIEHIGGYASCSRAESLGEDGSAKGDGQGALIWISLDQKDKIGGQGIKFVEDMSKICSE